VHPVAPPEPVVETESVAKAASGKEEAVKAPMAGHILRINVKEGQWVEANQVLVIMEAMKMETDIRVRKAGQVLEVCVKIGDSVSGNDVLVKVG